MLTRGGGRSMKVVASLAAGHVRAAGLGGGPAAWGLGREEEDEEEEEDEADAAEDEEEEEEVAPEAG